MTFELQRGSLARLKGKLTSHFRDRVVSVQPLSPHGGEERCMQMSFRQAGRAPSMLDKEIPDSRSAASPSETIPRRD